MSAAAVPSPPSPPHAPSPAHVLALVERGDAGRALALAHLLVQAEPGSADAWNAVGLAAAACGQLSSALRFLDQAIALDGESVEAHNNRGGVLCGLGRAAEGIDAFASALRRRPDDPAAWDNLLLASHLVPTVTPEAAADLHRAWGRRVEASTAITRIPPPLARAGRPLRIGYVSGDLRRHPVAAFIEPVLAHHDRDRYQVLAYATSAGGDEVTTRLRAKADDFRAIAHLSDDEGARLIAADRVDVLVDLSGHTRGNRLGLFARRPAPLQIAYLGYPGTTGLRRMDFRITDAWADPPGTTEPLHTEALLRVSGGFLCYGGADLGADAAPLPAGDRPGRSGRGRPFTFGSFNHLSKLGPTVVRAWARILTGVPRARLLLKAHGLSDPEARAAVRAAFEKERVDPRRIDLEAHLAEITDHLRRYDDVDLALDPFPYSGTTTTCEALSMGTPVLTLAGRAHVSRVSAALLAQVGLPDLVASSEEDYVRRAVIFAERPGGPAEPRSSLRDRVARSPLMDAAAFVRRLEAAFDEAWAAIAPGRAA